ncbi:hypothetical protein GCM10010293_41170 [Streptomyces griseoflavus]|nr:hypothetical protein GCM10010293_41170 [Streptomyces griseoflavus]
MRKVAAHRIARIAAPREKRTHWTLSQHVDHQTSMADARIALCVAEGISLDDIDPASGYSLSRASYESVRESWRYTVKAHGWSECYRGDLEEVRAYWSERRPEFTEGDDWLAGLVDHCEGAEGGA